MSNLVVGNGGGSWLTVDPERFRTAARTLAATAQANERALVALDTIAGELTAGSGGWSGRASREFLATWTLRAEQFRDQIRIHRDASAILDRFAADLQAAQQDYGWTLQRAQALGATLTPDGQVVVGNLFADQLLGPPPELAEEVAALEREAAAVHTRVTDADRRATTLLLALADHPVARPDYAEGLPTLLQAGISGDIRSTAATPGVDPALAAAWFAALSPAVRERLITSAPNLIGTLDGLPPDVRDRANRYRIRHELAAGRADLAARKRELATGNLTPMQAVALRRHVEELEDHLAVREQTLTRLLSSDYQILAFDNRGEGRAVVASGDLTRASNVTVLVAGMGTTIDNLRNTIENGDRLREEIEARFGRQAAQDTAVVTWFDYDAPDGLGQAWDAGYGKEGAPRLAQFTEGLQTIHEGDPHLSMVAHSYGSSTAGMAAAQHGLPAVDDLVFIGSPGVTVDSADQLNLDEGARVWAALNSKDEIIWEHKVTSTLLGVSGEDLILGSPPTRPDFGAEAFTANADGGHSDYFDRDSDSLRNIARIVVNRPGLVQ